MPAQIKTPWRMLGLGAAGLVVVGSGAIAYRLWISRLPRDGMPVGANLIPQSALLSLSLTTDTEQWQQLKQLSNSGTQGLVTKLNQFKTQFFSDRGLDYSRDIKPWVGDQSTVALLPITPTTVTTRKQQPQLWILPIAKPDIAQATFNRLSSQQPQQRTYKGIAIRQTDATATQPYAIAILENQAVFTSSPDLIDQVIDTYQGKPSLVQLSRYRPAWQQIGTANPFAQVYINLPGTMAQTTTPPTKAASPSQHPSAKLQGFAATINLEPTGVQAQGMAWLEPDSPAAPALENRQSQLTDRLPSNALAVYSGSNFQQFWLNYTQGKDGSPPTSLSPQQIRTNFQTATGMNFDQDMVNWMNGEFAAAIVPAGENKQQGAALVLLSQTRDRSQAEKSFNRLDQVVRQRQQWLVNTAQVDNQKITTWKVPPGLPVATHGWLDDNTAFLTLGSTVTSFLLPKPENTLSESPLFQAVLASQPKSSNGQLFIDMPRTLSLLNNSPLLPKLSPELKSVAEGIQAIGITSAAVNGWSTRYDIRFQLKQ